MTSSTSTFEPRFLAVVMRFAQRLDIVRIKTQRVVTFVRHDMIANRAKRLGHTTFSACKHDIDWRHTVHAKVAQAENAMWMCREMSGTKLLPVVAIPA